MDYYEKIKNYRERGASIVETGMKVGLSLAQVSYRIKKYRDAGLDFPMNKQKLRAHLFKNIDCKIVDAALKGHKRKGISEFLNIPKDVIYNRMKTKGFRQYCLKRTGKIATYEYGFLEPATREEDEREVMIKERQSFGPQPLPAGHNLTWNIISDIPFSEVR